MSDDGVSIYPTHDQQDDHACSQCGLLTDHNDGSGYPSLCAMCAEPSLSDAPACDCSEEYGPCEDHSELLVSREGASLRTADELTMVLISDLIACGAVASTDDLEEIARLENALENERSPVSGCAWFDDSCALVAPIDAEIAYDIAQTLESTLPDGIQVYSDDGYRIVRVTGGPLS